MTQFEAAQFHATYYDGRTSARLPVVARSTGGGLHVTGQDVNFEVPLGEIAVDAPLAGVPRSLGLPGGGQLKTDDHAAIEKLFPRAHAAESAVHRLEGRWRYALAGLAAIAVFGWWIIAYGLPLAAKLAAGAIPAGAETAIAEQALRSIDRTFCAPSRLDAKRSREVQAQFALLTAGLDDGYRYRLEGRDCGALGPNAFALPGGTVIMTDALVALAGNDEQLAAILAHEIGHVRHRHGLRSTLQAAGVAALIAALMGDAVSITSLAATLPAALLQTGYSREFEEEADTYAFQRLKEVSISPRHFADAMELLAKARGAERSAGYLSTHPATSRRIERALESAR